MMMMMIMIAGFVDSITSPIKNWLDVVVNTHDHHNTTSTVVVKELGVGSSRVDCIVCLTEVASGERLAMLERCKHGFHVECVEAWLKDHPNCPLCRAPISGSNQDTHKHSVMGSMTDKMSIVYSPLSQTMPVIKGFFSSRFQRAAVTCDISHR